MAVYEEHGVRFEYPEGWELGHEHHDGDFSVTVESDGTAFWMLSVLQGRPTAEEVVEAALESFKAEYDSVDVYESQDRICMLPTVAKEIDFYELEMVNRASLRACETDSTTMFVLLQMSDTERAEIGPLLKSISESLMWNSSEDEELDTASRLFAFDNLFGEVDDSGDSSEAEG
ncbi:MAG: hypothetical protein O3B13_08520 [Planctomycetota bacterium]|nr:hypothetical protein [Planctomycetota bacterium]MDA1163130.1 hypothetical protein [Planctomycetota bacterium]